MEKNDENYSRFKLELLALKWAVVEKFREYLSAFQLVVFLQTITLFEHLSPAKHGALEQ